MQKLPNVSRLEVGQCVADTFDTEDEDDKNHGDPLVASFWFSCWWHEWLSFCWCWRIFFSSQAQLNSRMMDEYEYVCSVSMNMCAVGLKRMRDVSQMMLSQGMRKDNGNRR